MKLALGKSEDIRGVDILMYPIQLLDWLKTEGALRVAVDVRKVVGGSEGFDAIQANFPAIQAS